MRSFQPPELTHSTMAGQQHPQGPHTYGPVQAPSASGWRSIELARLSLCLRTLIKHIRTKIQNRRSSNYLVNSIWDKNLPNNEIYEIQIKEVMVKEVGILACSELWKNSKVADSLLHLWQSGYQRWIFTGLRESNLFPGVSLYIYLTVFVSND